LGSKTLSLFGAGCGKGPNYFYREIASDDVSCLFVRQASAAGGKGLNLNTFCAKRDYSAAPISPITLAQSYLLENWGEGGGEIKKPNLLEHNIGMKVLEQARKPVFWQQRSIALLLQYEQKIIQAVPTPKSTIAHRLPLFRFRNREN